MTLCLRVLTIDPIRLLTDSMLMIWLFLIIGRRWTWCLATSTT